MTARCPRHVLGLITLCLMFVTAPLSAQDLSITPASLSMLLGSGKSGTVKIGAGDCKPTWTASSSNDAKVTVSPETAGAGGARTFKIKAAKGLFNAMETVTITVDGVGENCDGIQVVEIQVFVVMEATAAKRFEKGDKGTNIAGVKGRQKVLSTALKNAEKTLKTNLAQILKDQKAGTLVLDGDGPGFTLPQSQLAFDMSSDSAAEAFADMLDAFEAYIKGLAQDGHNVQSLYGLLDFLDYVVLPAFADGSCGAWDNAVMKGSDVTLAGLYKVDGFLKSQATKIVKESMKSSYPININFGYSVVESPLSSFGLSPTNLQAADLEKGKVLKVRKAEASNYVDENNDNNHGRIKMKGKAPASAGAVNIKYERLNSNGDPIGTDTGDFYEQTNVTVDAKCKFKGRAPSGELPNLKPGRWRITVTQGSGDAETTAERFITVPTGTAGVE